jgi:ketosteroid isomerase-like protein
MSVDAIGGGVSENADILKRGYEAFNSGDVETVSEVFADDASWEGPNTAGVPMSGKTTARKPSSRRSGRSARTSRSSTSAPTRWSSRADTIVVLSHLDAKTKVGRRGQATRRRDLAHERRQGNARDGDPNRLD